MRCGTGASRPARSTAGSAEVTASHPPPAVSGRRIRLDYITQPKSRPPSFVLFSSRADAVPDAYRRYLVNSLREAFDLPGTPIRILRCGRRATLCEAEEEAAARTSTPLHSAETRS